MKLGYLLVIVIISGVFKVTLASRLPWAHRFYTQEKDTFQAERVSSRQDHYCDMQSFKVLDESRVQSLCVDPSDGNVYLAAYDTNSLISYDSSGNTRRWDTPVRTPKGVFANNGYIYVNSLEEYTIFVLNKNGDVLNGFYYGDISLQAGCNYLAGIASDSERSDLYCNNLDDNIYQFHANRDTVTFREKWRADLGTIHHAIAAASKTAPLLYVSEQYSERQIIKLSASDHTVISRFGKNDFTTEPFGVYVDSFGYVLVGHGRDIFLFGPSDEYICKFPSQQLEGRVHGVAIGVDGVVWASSWFDNKVMLLR